jgi:hypothetical protein
MKWEKGRLGTGYEKLCLFKSEKFKFDIYFLKFPKNSVVDLHFDKVKNYKHYRLNITLFKAKLGGIYNGNSIFKLGRINLFRPDEMEHSISKVIEGNRYVLSFGWLVKK